jgi:hypothetical protein
MYWTAYGSMPEISSSTYQAQYCNKHVSHVKYVWHNQVDYWVAHIHMLVFMLTDLKISKEINNAEHKYGLPPNY